MLVVVDVKKENLFNHIKMKQNMQWKEWKLKEKETRENFKDKLKELVCTEAKDLWGSFKNGILKACEELCGRKKQSNRARKHMVMK